MRVSNQDLVNSITKCNTNKVSLVDPNTANHLIKDDSTLIDKNGLTTSNAKEAYAMKTTQNGVSKYKIVVNIAREPFRPDDRIYQQESVRQSKTSALPPFNWADCSDKVYDKYCRFLKSKREESYPKFIG